MVENFGSYLKHERELRGVPLQEIADNTKIPMRFLQALENNDLDELPGEVFIKGYIRSYAKSIGTNEDEILLAFDASAGGARKEKKRQQSENEKKEFSARRKKYWKTTCWVLACLLILVAAGRLIRLSNEAPEPKNHVVTTLDMPDSKPSPSKPPQPKPPSSNVLIVEKKETVILPTKSPVAIEPLSKTTQEAAGGTASQIEPPSETTPEEANETISQKEFEPAISPLPEPSTPAPETNLEEKTEPGGPEKSMEPTRKDDIIPPIQKLLSANVTQPLELTIQVKEQSWFELLIDGTRTEDFILPEGTGKTFKGENSFQITIGNRNGTELSLNGKLLVLPPSSEREESVVRDFLIQANPLE